MYMKNLALIFLLVFASLIGESREPVPSEPSHSETNYLKISSELMQGVMDGKDVGELQKTLAEADLDVLAKQLKTDLNKKTFWINVYNAYIQIILSENPELFEDRGSFFGKKRIIIAGENLSFDRIEHGIIRGSRSKLTLGFTKKLFVPKFERKLRCKKRDGRIHFALNCGAKSCPKVAVYYADRMDEQLDAITKQFLTKVTEVKGNTVQTTVLFSWFRGDFGGLDGVEPFLKKYGIIPQNLDADIEFKPYDWTLYLNNYTEV